MMPPLTAPTDYFGADTIEWEGETCFGPTRLGRRPLAERRSSRTVLCDRGALRDLPPESLGRRYLAFMEEESIYFEELARATERVPQTLTPLDPDRQFVFDHLVYMHDLLQW